MHLQAPCVLEISAAEWKHSRQSHNRQILYKAFHYFGIIILFAFGAGIGSILIPVFNLQTIWFSSFLLMVGFFLMFIQEK